MCCSVFLKPLKIFDGDETVLCYRHRNECGDNDGYDEDDCDDGGGNDDEKERLRMKQTTLVVSAVAVLILATKLAERCDFTQLDLRGRSGTRKDLRNWMIGRYVRRSCHLSGE